MAAARRATSASSCADADDERGGVDHRPGRARSPRRPRALARLRGDERLERPNGRLNSAPKRAASAGVRFVPPPPMTIGIGVLDRLRQRRRVDDRVVRAGVVERLADRCRPQPVDDRELLLEPVEPLAERRERDAVGLVLGVVPAGAEAELDPAAAHLVDLGDADGQRPGRRNVAEVTSVPRRIVRRLPGQAGERDPGVGRPGRPETSPILR